MSNRYEPVISAFASLLLGSALLGTGSAFGIDTITVNEPGGIGVVQSVPTLTGTSDGGLLLFVDNRTGQHEFRLRALDMEGMPTHASVPIEASLSPSLEMVSASMGSNVTTGSTVALWRLFGADGRQIVRLDPVTGQTIGSSVTILDDEPLLSNYDNGSVFVADDGVCLVLFETSSGLRARLFNANFYPLGPSFLIGGEMALGPMTAGFHADGSFTVTWLGLLEPYFDRVQSQRFNPDGSAAGPIYNYTDDEVFLSDGPVLGVRPDGSGMIAWKYFNESSEAVIYGQKFDTFGVPEGEKIVLVDPDALVSAPSSLYPKADGGWVLVQAGTVSAAVCVFDGATLEFVSEEIFIESHLPSSSWLPSTESVLVAWNLESSTSYNDIMGSTVSTDGYGRSDPSMLSDDVDAAWQGNVVAASNQDGRSVLVWQDDRFGESQLFMQRYDADGTPLGGNVHVAGEGEWLSAAKVAINASGASIVAWEQIVDDERCVMVQRHDPYGKPIGGHMNASTGTVEKSWGDLAVGLFDDGSFVASWGHEVTLPWPADYEVNLHVRMFNADGSPRSAAAPMVNIASSQILDHEPFDIVTRSDGSAMIFYHVDDLSSSGGEHGGGTSIQWLRTREIASHGYPTGSERTIIGASDYFTGMSAAGDDDLYAVAYSIGFDDGVSVRHYAASGVLVSSDFQTGDLGFSERGDICFASDGSSYLVYADSRWGGASWLDAMRYKRYDSSAEPDEEPVFMIDLGDNFTFLEDTIAMVAGERLELAYEAASSDEQGRDIHLSRMEIILCAPSDFDCDGKVDGFDLGWLLGFWGQESTDITGDGTTDGADLAILLGAWTG